MKDALIDDTGLKFETGTFLGRGVVASYMNLGDLESRLFCTVKRGVYFFGYILAVFGADWM